MTVESFVLALGGLACTALSMRKHHAQVHGDVPSPRRIHTWLVSGAALMAFSLMSSIARDGTGVGIVAWTGFLTIGSLTITLLLTYRPRIVFPLAIGAAMLGLTFAFSGSFP